jgi:indoleamine 2,3-dioxygenase
MFNGHESESGFINVHVAIDYQSGDLLAYQQDVLKNLDDRNMEGFVKALSNHANIFENMVSSLKTMWKSSDLNDYLSFRTFIMGQKGNKVCYPNERLVFSLNDKDENETEIHSYRGETGAQDSIIPSVDNLLALEYPKNKLTEYLFQLRNYRPKDHQAYIEYNLEQSKNLGLKDYAKEDSNASFQLLRNLESLRAFRSTHWNLTKSYIIKNTKHPVATGGTPITTWLPNQLGATLDYMSEIVEMVDIQELNENDVKIFTKIVNDLENQKEFIFNEVSKLQEDFTHEDAI